MGGYKSEMTGSMGSKGPPGWVSKNGTKVNEHKVVKEPEPEEPKPEPVATGQRFYNGHKINYTKDVFCNMRCENCGIESKTYLTPFKEACQKAQTHDYDIYC